MVAGEVGADGHTQEQACLNCSAALAGDYCHACGQHAHVHRTISAFFHDLMHGVLHFEGKIWRTLPLLVLRPGELTRRCIDGQRARFVSPIALFLFSVFLMFAMLGMTGQLTTPNTDVVRTQMAASVVKDEAKLKLAKAERNRLAAAGKPVEEANKRIENLTEELGLERAVAKGGVIKGSMVRISDDVPNWLRGPLEKAGKNPEL